jgi:hypothetical protein
MTRNENQMYSDITSIRKSLEKIANALDTPNVVYNGELKNTKDIPGFEGTLDALDVLTDIKTITDEYASKENLANMTEARDYYKEKYENTLTPTSDNPDPAGYGNEDDTIHNDYLEEIVKDMNHIQYLNFHHEMAFGFPSSDTAALSQHIYELEYEEVLGAIKTALFIKGDSDYVSAVECSGFNKERKDELAREYVIDLIKETSFQNNILCNDCSNENQYGKVDKCVCQDDGGDGYYTTDKNGNKDPYTYETNLQRIRVDSDHDIRSTAAYYEDTINDIHCEDIKTKKDAILDYVTNEFGLHGARYTDIIKFAYYLGYPNALKYTSANRGYYSCAFATRFGGHLIQGGKDFLVKGINNEGKERYFAHSSVDNFTGFYKRIS